MKKSHPLPTLHQLRNKYTRTGIVWLFLIYGILYRELFTDETLLWCILITRWFFFFDSRWFALLAGGYFIAVVVSYFWFTHASAEHFTVYMFWYVVAWVVGTIVESSFVKVEK